MLRWSSRYPARRAFHHASYALLRGESTPYSSITIGVPKESFEGERRVAQVPETVKKLVSEGFAVTIESGAGAAASFSDSTYEACGAKIVDSASVWKSDFVLKVRPPSSEEAAKLENRKIFSFLYPAQNKGLVDQLQKQKATAFGIDQLPRTLSRGQAYDALSSQANIAGYRAVVEAASHFERFFTGQITAAGRVPPAKVLVLGAGVAGLAAIGAARNMGAIVRAFDVRAASKEQVESLGGDFLSVNFQEAGEGVGGYAKEMSPEWHAAAQRMLAEQCKEVDIIITTALIPGRKAPIMVTKEMVELMKPGSVTVDLAAEAGGNIATTVAGKVIQTPNGVTCVGYTDLPSRLATTSSTLYSNNLTKLLLSMGPQTTKEKGFLKIDHEDPAVRGVLVVEEGELMWPAPVPDVPAPPAPLKEVEESPAILEPTRTPYEEYQRSALSLSCGAVGLLGLGILAPDPSFVNLLSTFALSGIVGYHVVWGVTHSLHSPLMSVTNAISGMTALGGMYLMDHSHGNNSAYMLGAAALFVSSINIGGGFVVTAKMLDLFRRESDPEEHNHLYAIPAATMIAGYGLGSLAGYPYLEAVMGLASGVCCIGALAALSNQSSARVGNALGMTGVGLGVAATVGACSSTALPILGLLGAGSGLGYAVGQRVGPSELPQTVAAFHSLVGLAAMGTAIGDYMLYADNPEVMDSVRLASISLATFIGGMTATGSMVAFGKLSEFMNSSALKLPMRDNLNVAMGVGSLASLGLFMTNPSPETGLLCLGSLSLLSAGLGAHMTASIGGADMPVVITVLNSYSGWALCAEGFMLNQPLLTVVGSLIGSSGAILTHIVRRFRLLLILSSHRCVLP